MTAPIIETDHLAALQWGSDYLRSHGQTLKINQAEIVQNTPWSFVARFATSDGHIYLKQTPRLLGLEPVIIQTLRSQFHAPVPVIIEHNAKLNCFLMRDAGSSLRTILKQKFNPNLLCAAIDEFSAVQMSVADHIDVFLAIGVPDWRLDKLPDLYQQLLAKKTLLIADGLSELDIDKLETLVPTVAFLCEKLSRYAIKQSIVQPDFNDNNTLIDKLSQVITICDLGEITISHPFFSLLNCLHVLRKHHALTAEDAIYLQIQAACFKNYLQFESKTHLLEAFSLAHPLFFIYGALANERLSNACDKARLLAEYPEQARPGFSLKEFMSATYPKF